MSATLTPERTTDMLDTLEEQFLQELTCRQCSANPTKVHVRKCCGAEHFYCPSHSSADIEFLEKNCDRQWGIDCHFCGVVFRPLRSPDDAVRVVTL